MEYELQEAELSEIRLQVRRAVESLEVCSSCGAVTECYQQREGWICSRCWEKQSPVESCGNAGLWSATCRYFHSITAHEKPIELGIERRSG